MYKRLLVLFTFFISTPVFAGDADNISACVNKAKEFAGVVLDAYSVMYEGNVIAMSTAQWKNAFCEVKVGNVYTLQVDNQTYIYKGYAGKESYDLNASLQAKTEMAINQLNSRIALLQQRADQVSVSLHKPKPDKEWLTRYINEGIEKSLGSNAQLNTPKSTVPRANAADNSNIVAYNLPKAPKVEPNIVATASSKTMPEATVTVKAEPAAKPSVATLNGGERALWLEACKDKVREKLKDINSAIFRNVSTNTKGPGGMSMACGEVNAKNSFNGYSGFQKFVTNGTASGTFLQEEVEDFDNVWNTLCR